MRSFQYNLFSLSEGTQGGFMLEAGENLIAAVQTTKNGNLNKVRTEDFSIHSWYRFVLSFPPHLVRDYLGKFAIGSGQRVLDPFCGTGTTLVECKKVGIESVGVEANKMAHFASSVKLDWTPNPERLRTHAIGVAEDVRIAL